MFIYIFLNITVTADNDERKKQFWWFDIFPTDFTHMQMNCQSSTQKWQLVLLLQHHGDSIYYPIIVNVSIVVGPTLQGNPCSPMQTSMLGSRFSKSGYHFAPRHFCHNAHGNSFMLFYCSGWYYEQKKKTTPTCWQGLGGRRLLVINVSAFTWHST